MGWLNASWWYAVVCVVDADIALKGEVCSFPVDLFQNMHPCVAASPILQAILTRASAHMKRRNASSRASMKARYIVRCKNIILAFTSKVLLQRTNLELKVGTRYAIVGQNGVGKTTLLNRVAAKDINGFPQELNCYFVRHEIAASPGTCKCGPNRFRDREHQNKKVLTLGQMLWQLFDPFK